MFSHVANFHPVGQGLFYTGHLFPTHQQNDCLYCALTGRSKFSYVYDCGTVPMSNKAGVKRIANILNQSNDNHSRRCQCFRYPYSLAVISHLHEDHINGFPLLFQYISDQISGGGKPFENIVIPNMEPEDIVISILNYAEVDTIDPEDPTYRILSSPVQFFSEYADRIIQIQRTPDGDTEGGEESLEPDSRRSGTPDDVDPFESLDYQPGGESMNGADIRFASTRKPIRIHLESDSIEWRISFYQKTQRSEDQERKQEFKENMQNHSDDIIKKAVSSDYRLRNEALNEIVSSKGLFQSLKDIFKKSYKSGRHDYSINNTSLSIYSRPEPLRRDEPPHRFSYNRSRLKIPADSSHEEHCSELCSSTFLRSMRCRQRSPFTYGKPGYILTGDMDLSTDSSWEDFVNSYSLIPNDNDDFSRFFSLVFQIPHHGSKHDFNANHLHPHYINDAIFITTVR